MKAPHFSAYEEATTRRCERALVTLIGDIGPWRERIYLAGGLAPRYIVGELPGGRRAHVGTTDVDLIIGLAIDDESLEAYQTLESNIRAAGFRRETSFRWKRDIEGFPVTIEFLCETTSVRPGAIFKPKGESTGSGLGAFNIPGAQLVADDFREHTIEAERLDGGGLSSIQVRIANLLPYAVLKILAFQDRHENKDAYDLIFCILNFGTGPGAAGRAAASSQIINHELVASAMQLLEDRFANSLQDGPIAYATFLADREDSEEYARLCQESVATVRLFFQGLRSTGENQQIP